MIDGTQVRIIQPDHAYSQISVRLPVLGSNRVLIDYVELNGVENAAVSLSFKGAEGTFDKRHFAEKWLGRHVFALCGGHMFNHVPPHFQDNYGCGSNADYRKPHTRLGEVDWTLLNELMNFLLKSNSQTIRWDCEAPTRDYSDCLQIWQPDYRPAGMNKSEPAYTMPKLSVSMVAATTLQITDEHCKDPNSPGRRTLHFDTLNRQNAVKHVLETCAVTWPHTQPKTADA